MGEKDTPGGSPDQSLGTSNQATDVRDCPAKYASPKPSGETIDLSETYASMKTKGPQGVRKGELHRNPQFFGGLVGLAGWAGAPLGWF